MNVFNIMEGILILNKPSGFTSHDCVSVVRGLTGVKKVGHTGTLDPMATGILIVCIGKATRIIEYIEKGHKQYRCVMQLGVTTDTQDIWGSIIEHREPSVTMADIKEAFKRFVGDIEQIPPKYSAIKVNGRKLYDYARSGQNVEIKPRAITVDGITVSSFKGDKVEFIVNCRSGTYVRTICNDVGRVLGCGAAMCALERTENGSFTMGDAISLEELRKMDRSEIEGLLLPLDRPLGGMNRVDVDRETAIGLINGKRLNASSNEKEGLCRIYSSDAFIGTAKVYDGKYIAEKF